jgi:2-polyprenyl-3-methyl-5-hydroxy-6-metoxy-1,4-benzoquinol methylase
MENQPLNNSMEQNDQTIANSASESSLFSPTEMACTICGNTSLNQLFMAKEQMFGLGHRFTYFVCHACGALHRTDPLPNAGDYYPKNYYSYRLNQQQGLKARLERQIKILRAGLLAGKQEGWRKNILKRFPNPGIDALLRIPLKTDSRILDFGCGNGALLYDMKEQGFTNLLGADPYLDADIQYKNGLKVLKRDLHQIEGVFDLIMLHHVFEHIDSPLTLLREAADHLAPGAILLIRIPLADSLAWETYRQNWVQLDAPRHVYLHTHKSMSLLAKEAGLHISRVVHDGNYFQFWGSEQYQKGFPLTTNPEEPLRPKAGLFSPSELKEMQHKALALNHVGRSDQAAFYLVKASE